MLNDSTTNDDLIDDSLKFLTSKQQGDLHYAILDYVYHCGFRQTFQTFLKEAHLQNYDPSMDDTHRHTLEKKWISLIRLQKKVLNLEIKLTQLQEENPSLLRPSHQTEHHKSSPSNTWTDLIPKGPERVSFQGHRMSVTKVAFHHHPSYPILASASEDATIRIYDLESGAHEKTLRGHTHAIHDLCFDPSPSGIYLASCSADLTIKLWQLDEDYACVRTLHGHEHVVNAIRFIWMASTKQLLLASGSRDQTIRIWEVTSGYCLRQYTGHRDWIRSIDISEDSLWIASAGNDKTVHVWNTQTGETHLVLEGHLHTIECVAFAPLSIGTSINRGSTSTSGLSMPTISGTNSSYLASAARDKTISIWDIQSGDCVMTLNGHDNWVRGITFHPGGKYLISVSDDQSIRVWDLRTGKACRIIEQAHSNFITCVAFNVRQITTSSPKHLLMATGSFDQSVKVWDCR